MKEFIQFEQLSIINICLFEITRQKNVLENADSRVINAYDIPVRYLPNQFTFLRSLDRTIAYQTIQFISDLIPNWTVLCSAKLYKHWNKSIFLSKLLLSEKQFQIWHLDGALAHGQENCDEEACIQTTNEIEYILILNMFQMRACMKNQSHYISVSNESNCLVVRSTL